MRRFATALPVLLAVLATGCSTPAPSATTPAGAAASAPVAPAPAAFCDAARANIELETTVSASLSRGIGDVKPALAKIRASNAAVEAAAPAEISADVQSAYSLSNKQLDLIESGGTAAAASVAQDPAFSALVKKTAPALARVGAYLKDKCGIDPAAPAGSGG